MDYNELVTKADETIKNHRYLIPPDINMALHLEEAILSIVDGIKTTNWDAVAEGLVILTEVQIRLEMVSKPTKKKKQLKQLIRKNNDE